MAGQPRRALWVGGRENVLDGERRSNPDGMFDTSLPELIAVMMRIVCGAGVVLLSRAAARLMTLPTGDALPAGADAKNHAAAVQLRSAGFTVKEIGRWFQVKHAEHGSVWFGLTEFLDVDYFPLGEDPVVVTAALAQWHAITGHVWQGSAGDAGNAILRSITYKQRRKMARPQFWSWEGPEGEPIELPYLTHSWRRRDAGDVIYGYDRVRAYLAAMTCTPVAGDRLTHTGRTTFDPRQSGWWLCHLGPWEFEHAFPDPAGAGLDRSAPVWLTTPRVQLLADIAADGFYQFDIVDSWTAPATPVIKNYGTGLRVTWEAARLIEDPAVRAAVRSGVKAAYRIGHGYWRSRQSLVQRPDWSSAITAMSAANIWRKTFKVWENGGTFDGPRPVMIDTDNVWYDVPPEALRALSGWTIWDGDRDDLDDVTSLGDWRTGGVRRRKVSRETTPDVSRETVRA